MGCELDLNKFKENLQDAGCSEEVAEQVINDIKIGNKNKAMKTIRKYRKSLLEVYHGTQKKLDCLDYLIYKYKSEDSDDDNVTK